MQHPEFFRLLAWLAFAAIGAIMHGTVKSSAFSKALTWLFFLIGMVGAATLLFTNAANTLL